MELLGGNGHGVPGRSTQGKSHGLSSSSRCKLRCSAHHRLQAVHLPSWQVQSAASRSIRWKIATAERGKHRGGRGFACGPSQLRLSGGRPTGRFLFTLTVLHYCINFSKSRPPPRSEGCRAFDFSDRPPDAPLFCELISFRPLAEVTGQPAVIGRHLADISAPGDSRNETLWKVFPIFGRDFIPPV